MKTILKNCRLLGTSHDKDMLHDIYVKDGVIEKIGLHMEEDGAKVLNVGGHMISQRFPERLSAAALLPSLVNPTPHLLLIIRLLWNISFPNPRKNLW